MSESKEFEASAEYWLDAGHQHLICDAWAVDKKKYTGWKEPKLVYVSAMGTLSALQQAARDLRTPATKAHLTSSDRSRWHTSLNTFALQQSQLFRTPLPETDLHHMTLLPADQREFRDHLIPLYFFPETAAELPHSLGNKLRWLTNLLCPPQWDHALLETCQQLKIIQPLEAHGVNAWSLMLQEVPLQEELSRQVKQGSLRL